MLLLVRSVLEQALQGTGSVVKGEAVHDRGASFVQADELHLRAFSAEFEHDFVERAHAGGGANAVEVCVAQDRYRTAARRARARRGTVSNLEELSLQELEELRELLSAARTSVEQQLSASAAGAKPVDLGLSIGRLSRVDAVQ